MTGHSIDDEEIVSIDDFEAALGRLVQAAKATDIDPHGSWVFRTEDGGSDVEVMVFKLDDRYSTDQ